MERLRWYFFSSSWRKLLRWMFNNTKVHFILKAPIQLCSKSHSYLFFFLLILVVLKLSTERIYDLLFKKPHSESQCLPKERKMLFESMQTAIPWSPFLVSPARKCSHHRLHLIFQTCVGVNIIKWKEKLKKHKLERFDDWWQKKNCE